jgi:ABC-2 type transport system permease protein
VNARLRTLVAKELQDLRRSPGVFLPALLTSVFSLVLPFIIAIVVPTLTGERLSNSSDLRAAMDVFRQMPLPVTLDDEGTVQAFVFQQFLVLLVLGPVAASMSSAAYSVVGEKRARTLEPLLATPVTATELLGSKILGAFVPALVLTTASYVLYVGATALVARPGVFRVLLTPGALVVVLLVGPLAALAALQMAVCASSRASDERSAQQIGAIIILPIAGLLVAQAVGSLVVTTRLAFAIAAGLVALNLGLLRLAVTLFGRETILTRWK